MDHLGAWQDEGLDLLPSAAGIVVGAGIAKVVVDKLVGAGGALKKAGAAAGTGLFPEDDLFPGATLVGGLVPAAVGIALQVHAPGSDRDAKGKLMKGAAIGMVAYSVGKIVVSLLPASSGFVPFAGLGEADVYDYGMSGLGIGPGDVTAYMNGAPTTADSLMGLGAGAPVDVELAGAPVSISGGGMSAAFY